MLALWSKGISSKLGFSLYIWIPSTQLQTPGEGSHSAEHAQLWAGDITIQWRHLKVLWTSLAAAPRRRAGAEWPEWVSFALEWDISHLAALLLCHSQYSAIGCSPALSIAGSLKRHCTERVNCCKPRFLVEQSQGSSTAAIPQSWAARSRKTWGQQRLSQFVC